MQVDEESLTMRYRETCATLDIVADKWTALVIAALRDGPCRYSAMKRRIGDVSDKMLAQTLRKLEDHGLVRRTVYPVIPPQVEYALTPVGASLVAPLQSLVQWAHENTVAAADGPTPAHRG